MAGLGVDSTGLRIRHIAAATLGNALEFYDFITFAFFAIQIGHAFFPGTSAYGSLMASLATFGAGFVTRPVGALVLGNYADRRGRKPAMILSFILMGSSIVCLALIPSYATIGIAAPVLAVMARLAQGFSLGGEIGSNTAFLLEAAPPARRGFIISWQVSSQCAAFAAGGCVGVLLNSFMPPATFDVFGWRIAFLLGAATLPFGIWLRRSLPETLHTHEAAAVQPASPAPRLAIALDHWRVVVLGLAILGSFTVTNYCFAYMTTYVQNTLRMPAGTGFAATAAGNILSIFTVLYGGRLSDRIGRWPVNVFGNLALLVSIYPVFHLILITRSEIVLVVGVTLLIVMSNTPAGAFYAALAESLPKTIRGTGFATIYSVSIAALGGTTQLVVTWLIHITGNPFAPAWYMIGASLLGQTALTLFRESAPMRLIVPAYPAASARTV